MRKSTFLVGRVDLDLLDSINKFNEWQPLADFEASKSFTSLRSIVEEQSDQWLDSQISENINFDNDPDELCPIIDEETRTLFNSSGYVKIGNGVVSKQEWADEAESVWDCCAFRRSSKYTFDANNHPTKLADRQVKAKISVRSGVVKSTLKGKVKHYKKVNGNYKKRRADIRLGIQGRSFNGDCVDMPQNWWAWKGYKKRRTRRVKSHIWQLWREAIVCREEEKWLTMRSGLYFYIDSDDYQFSLYLVK